MSSDLSFRKTMWLLSGGLIRKALVCRPGGCYMVLMRGSES